MRSSKLFVNILTLFIVLTAGSLIAQGISSRMYLKVPEENLRFAPSGKKIGSLLEGAEMRIVQEQDKWVKVQITGWIWKESLTNVKPEALKGAYRALHILVKTRPEAEEILKQIKAGKDFAELAKSKSISPSGPKGGDLGYFNKGDFPSNIENAIVNLQVNAVSEIIETKFGFNIFKRLK